MKFFSTSPILFAASPVALAAFRTTSNQNVATYWGQNSYQQSTGVYAQQTLGYYCKNTNIDMIPMAFMNQITTGQGNQPNLNFANQQNGCSTFPGTNLINCPQIAADIKTCQDTYKKSILLSIGGATYTEGGFASETAAVATANKLWAMFGPVQPNSNALRPFGNTSINGFDLDFESTVSNTVPFVRRLRALMNADTAVSKKTYYITAAPQCPELDGPNFANSPMLRGPGAIFFDAIFIQFYNNYCGLQSFTPGTSTQNNFNFATWDKWAKNESKNRNVKVFLGIPGGPSAAGSGYTAMPGLQPIIKYCKTFTSFGGVMVWDVSQSQSRPGYLADIKKVLSSSVAPSPSPTPTPSSKPTAKA